VVDMIYEEIRRVQSEGITPAELEVISSRLIGQHLFSMEENSSLAFSASLDELYGLGYENWTKYPEKIREVTPEMVKNVALEYLLEDDYALVIVGPRQNDSDE